MPDTDRREFLTRSLPGSLLALAAPLAVRTARAAQALPESEASSSDTGSLPRLVLPHPSGAVAEILLQGAQVTSWKRANGEEMLFVSANNRFTPGETVRGGIPVIFPQFANLGPLPGHGFLKTADWQVASTGFADGVVHAVLTTSDSAATRAMWPHPFRASLRVALGDSLDTAITIDNTGERAFDFHCVLHTYHRVGDLRQVRIDGVENALYRDRLAKEAERREVATPLAIDGETNRIYVGRPGALRIRDASRGRTVVVERSGFDDVVIWNPGVLKARTSTGLAEGEYLTMLAVEAARIASPVRLTPGASWTGAQTISVES